MQLAAALLVCCALGGPVQGTASWYDLASVADPGITASGEPLIEDQLTAASRDLPLGSYALVQNDAVPDRYVIVRINDRGPYCGDWRDKEAQRKCKYVVDLTPAAAARAGMVFGREKSVPYGGLAVTVTPLQSTTWVVALYRAQSLPSVDGWSPSIAVRPSSLALEY